MTLVYSTLFSPNTHTHSTIQAYPAKAADYPARALSYIGSGATHAANCSCLFDAAGFLFGKVLHQGMQGQTRCAHSKGINKNRTCTKK